MSLDRYLRRFGIFTALALGVAVGAPPSASADEAPTETQIIVVNGLGEVRVRPDSLSVDVGVDTRAATLEQARSQAAAGLVSVLDAIRALDVPGLAIETRALSVSPVYASSREDKPPRIVGYAASHRVSITIANAPVEELGERGARVIDAALMAGANNVGSLQFFVADPTAAEDDALADAVRNAARDADIIARTAGVSLGGLLAVEETPGLRLLPRSITFPSVVATPVEVEDIVVTSSVTATFEFHAAR